MGGLFPGHLSHVDRHRVMPDHLGEESAIVGARRAVGLRKWHQDEGRGEYEERHAPEPSGPAARTRTAFRHRCVPVRVVGETRFYAA